VAITNDIPMDVVITHDIQHYKSIYTIKIGICFVCCFVHAVLWDLCTCWTDGGTLGNVGKSWQRG